MNVELDAYEIGFLVGLISEYKKTHPYNIQENIRLTAVVEKMLHSVHGSIKNGGERTK